jgi:hypothetical protein
MAVGFDISGVVCLVSASLVVSDEAPVGCLQPYFHWFFPLSHYFTDWSWFEIFFFFFFALFPALLHSVVKVIYLLYLCGGVFFLASLLIEIMASASSSLVPNSDLISISKDEYAQFLTYK